MGKYDEEYKELQDFGEQETKCIEFFMYKIANELAESNRLTRQELCKEPGMCYDREKLVDQA